MAVDAYGVVKGLNVLKYQPVSLVKRVNAEAIQPFPLDQGMKRFDTGIIVRVTLMAVAQLGICSLLPCKPEKRIVYPCHCGESRADRCFCVPWPG